MWLFPGGGIDEHKNFSHLFSRTEMEMQLWKDFTFFFSHKFLIES